MATNSFTQSKIWAASSQHAPNFTKRDASLLRALINGASYAQASAGSDIVESRVRVVTTRLAVRLMKACRIDEPTLALKFEFKVAEFVKDSAIWNDRLDKYLPAIEATFDHA